ncbi:MAG: peptidylprolyl isomerase [Acidobacteria bacterium]|nr:MAG: peptidylprolyl isomerase [Acidobacteriota bacterium]
MACGGGDSTATPSGPTSLQIEDLTVGTGATAAVGDTVSVGYIGTFLDGRVFDPGPGPITFQIGAGRVIPGFEQGIIGMRVGGKRRITVPSALAYGSAGFPPTIPPNTPLRFEVTLVAIAGK